MKSQWFDSIDIIKQPFYLNIFKKQFAKYFFKIIDRKIIKNI